MYTPYIGGCCAEVTAEVRDDLKDKTEEIQGDWDIFAQKIGLSPRQVNDIRSNLQLMRVEQKRREAIDVWFKMSLPLEDIVCALHDMGYIRDANAIVKKYCGDRGQTSRDICKK